MPHHVPRLLATILFAATASAQTSIHDIQYTTDPSGDSPLVGQVVTTGGVVTAVHYDGFVMYEGAAPWQAVFVYNFTAAPSIGDEVTLTGTVQEYAGMTEITGLAAFSIVSQDNPVTPLVVSSAVAGQEQYESVLLMVEAPIVTGLLGYGEWTLDGSLTCDDLNDYLYFPQLDDPLTSVTGTLFYSNGAFKLQPRFTPDIVGDVIAHFALGGDVVTMNATRDVLIDHWVEIQGDRIVGIHSAPPGGLTAVATGGLIFPGLIDSHNHPVYNVLGPIPFEQTFEHRDEWRSHPLYDAFGDQYDAILTYTAPALQRLRILKLAEVRAMTSGTTTIQGPHAYGHSNDPYGRQGIGINNAHRWPPRIYHDTFPLWDTISQWQARAAENWRRFVVHVAEGTNAAALAEFSAWKDRVPLDERTTIIHGTGLGAPEWAEMAGASANLVWSPQSNITLYGTTADIPGALAAGVNVALAPDWTESGSNDVLAEMKVAQEWSATEWSGLLTPRQLAEMVTLNAADALGMSDIRGAVIPGLRADLMVIPGDAAAPYEALLAADQADVALTVISGRPGYGDPVLMDQFAELTMVEDITIEDQTKRLALAITAHGIQYSDQLFVDIHAELEAAYDAATPIICCFRGLEATDCDPVAVPETGMSVAALHVYPNPFHSRLAVSFSLWREETVSVEVFSVSGRRVAERIPRRFGVGEHVFTWDGRDSGGQLQAPGTYFVRLCAGETVFTEKAVMMP
jgi:imidazolonepropionase-like amidohydrolase